MFKRCLFFLWMLLIAASISYGQNCFAKKDGFGVIQPYLVEKVCFLYEHSLKIPPESELKQTIGSETSLHPDPLMAEFLYLIVNKRYISIKMGTPLFNCGNDLEMIRTDFEFAKLNGGIFPEFHCRGILSPFVPVKLKDQNFCHWVALDIIDCGNIPEEYDFELRWKR